MELDYDTRPLSIAHQSRNWNGISNGISAPSVATTSFVARRRSTAVHALPPGPPPSQPIPNLPVLTASHYGPYDGLPDAPDFVVDHDHLEQQNTANPSYARPAASPGLAAVAAFSQARYASASTFHPSPSAAASSSTDNLSDSPPRSMLRPIPSRSPPTQNLIPDRLLLSPTEPRPVEPRPSSRRALTKALELAREAVRLDSTNDDPYGAVMAYGKSVALLSEVMERVMRGEDSTESHRRRNGRRRSVVAQEEEVKRLKSIHDTYADRMNILSVIYSIPLPSHSPPSTYASSSVSVSSDSTQPSSPASTSPTSDTSEPSRLSLGPSPYTSETTAADELSDGEAEAALGTSGFTNGMPFGRTHSASAPSGSASPVHPYALQSSGPSSSPPATQLAHRPSVVPALRGRPRASSTLPPPAPPPTTLPPPAPASAMVEPPEPASTQHLRVTDASRSRGNSVGHKRTGSGRLAALREEGDDSSQLTPTPVVDETGRTRSRSIVAAAVADIARDSPPLPPIPPPSAIELTPRSSAVATMMASESSPPQSPGQFTTPRPRGSSTLPVHSEATPMPKQPLINTSTALGTISQRRVKTSAPPSTDMPSPTDSTISAASVPNMGRLGMSTLPASTMNSLGMGGRTRASSQPGRRPSIVSANSYPFPAPSGQGAPPSTSVLRKVSVPSRLNPQAPPQITVNTAILSPTLSAVSTPSLVPPPPIPYDNIPTAPLSPLPTLAPTDPLRKPYHMMFLLRQTMTSKTGGYITRRLHVPQEVWSQGGAKLTNIPEKIRVVEVLGSALEDLHMWSVEYFGAGNVSSGMALGIGSIGRKEGEAWAGKLEEFVGVCDGVVGQFGKKLGVGEGFITKKSSGVTSWGGRLTRQFDKITNGKNLDSPAAYVQGLSKLFHQAQLLDEHTKAATSQPLSALYAALPNDLRPGIELKLRHSSEFFAKVVLTFVIRDMALLLDKYVKKCEKWLAE